MMYLYGQNSTADFLCETMSGEVHLFGLEQPEQGITQEVRQELEQKYGALKRIEQRQTYYWLPLDGYNQPRGTVEEISLFPYDFEQLCIPNNMQSAYPYWWVYDNYSQALRRALD